jgi:hypothetical protein
MSDDRSKLDLSQPFNRGNDLLVYKFTGDSTAEQTRKDILRAFKEGFNCFRFEFDFQGRKFEDRIALPHAAGFDERDALEMAETAFCRFLNTAEKLLRMSN